MNDDSKTGVRIEAPTGYRDETDYTFHDETKRRRLSVVPAEAVRTDLQLGKTIKALRKRAKELLGASKFAEAVRTRPDGAAVATLQYALPSVADDPKSAAGARERIALIRFASGSAVQLSLVAAADDDEAEAEFQKLADSVQPAELPAAVHAFADAKPPVRQAGPVRLELAPTMLGPSVYQFASDDGDVRLALGVEAAHATDFAAAPSVGTARNALGQVVEYKIGTDPWATEHAGPRSSFADEAAPAPRSVGGVVVRPTGHSKSGNDRRVRDALTALMQNLRPAD
jgi:hypothetical protein